MVTVLLVADGASEPLTQQPTSLERAATPAIDRMLCSGVLQRARTIPAGMLPGTEVGVPALLGAAPSVQPSRGRIEAAAAGITVPDGHAAWRVDLAPARLPTVRELADLRAAAQRAGGRLEHLAGHRCLLVGPTAWGDGPPGPHQTSLPLGDIAVGVFAQLARDLSAVLEQGVAWPWGTVAGAWPHVPAQLGRRVIMVAAGGAPTGIGALLGCEVRVAQPADGAEIVAAADDDDVVVVHDPGPDDAGHTCSMDVKIAALERFDADVVAPVARVVEQRGGRVIVAADHGCDPATGRHDAAPVPVVLWSSGAPEGGARPRWTERDAAGLLAVPADLLLAEQLAAAAA